MPSHRADAQPLTRVRARSLTRVGAQQRRGSGRRATRRSKPPSLSVPHASIAGALGLATIAAPISGMMSAPPPAKAAFNAISLPSMAAPAFPYREASVAVERLSLVPHDDAEPAVPNTLLAPRDLLVTRPSRGRERAVLPGCFGEYPLLKVENGRMPATMLCTLWDDEHQLRADAAVALARLNVAYTQTFGQELCVSDGYRTLGEQRAVRSLRGWFAAVPGTSNHGWGRAADLCGGVENAGSREYRWMAENASRYGWENPAWARSGGNGPREPWHWEYFADGLGNQSVGD